MTMTSLNLELMIQNYGYLGGGSPHDTYNYTQWHPLSAITFRASSGQVSEQDTWNHQYVTFLSLLTHEDALSLAAPDSYNRYSLYGRWPHFGHSNL